MSPRPNGRSRCNARPRSSLFGLPIGFYLEAQVHVLLSSLAGGQGKGIFGAFQSQDHSLDRLFDPARVTA